MRRIIVFFIISVFSHGLRAQSQIFQDHSFGIGVEFRLNDTHQIIYSPALQFHPGTHISLYVGPVLLISLDQIDRSNQFSFHIGFDYLFKKSTNNLDKYVKLEMSKIKYQFNSIAYDYAVPNIPIQSTILHEHVYTDIQLNIGLRYHFMKRYYVSSDGGIRFLGKKLTDPDKYIDKYEGVPTILKILPALSLETGIYF